MLDRTGPLHLDVASAPLPPRGTIVPAKILQSLRRLGAIAAAALALHVETDVATILETIRPGLATCLFESVLSAP